MMKCLYFLLFVAASQAAVSRESRDVEDIPVPRLTRITLEDDSSLALKIHWNRVYSHDGDDRVLGYKVKVWEHSKTHSREYETVEENRSRSDDDDSSRSSNSDEYSHHKSRNIRVHGEDTTSARVDDIESGVTYEVRVRAYTRHGDGPLSRAMRIEVSNNGHDRQRDWYNEE